MVVVSNGGVQTPPSSLTLNILILIIVQRLTQNIKTTLAGFLHQWGFWVSVVTGIGSLITFQIREYIDILQKSIPIWLALLILLAMTCLFFLFSLIRPRSYYKSNKLEPKKIGGVTVFVKKNKKENEPEIWYCANCYTIKNRTSILQYDPLVRPSGTLKDMVCQRCNGRVTLNSWQIPGFGSD